MDAEVFAAINQVSSYSICLLFEEQVQRSPEAIAISSLAGCLTYHDLNVRVRTLAYHLRSRGVRPEVRVGLCVERSLEMIIGLLAILKAGGVYVPLDPHYPKERLNFMLVNAEVTVLLTQESLVQRFAQYEVDLIVLDSSKGTKYTQPLPVAITYDGQIGGHQAAYILYTSGSTGQPKGVVVEHRGVANMILSQIQLFNIHAGHRILQFASLSFDASLSECFICLITGATLVLQPPVDTSLFGNTLQQTLYEQAITTVTLPPSVLAVLPVENFPDVHTLIVAGEAGVQGIMEQWGRGRALFNAYGPTEATVCSAIAQWQPEISARCIGRPLMHVQLYVLDQRLSPVASGETGELYIGGLGLARGYLDNPALTAEHFLPNPFSRECGSRLYRSGDLARSLPDGSLEFVGRIDRQMKFHGFRIEPGEIEVILTGHPSVREAVVLLQDRQGGEQQLVAYLTGQPHSSIPPQADLQNYLKQYLPDYMIPSSFILLPVLPLTSSGKVDRDALCRMGPAQNEAAADFVAPHTPTEKILATIWTEVLGMDVEERIGRYDNFFELGGHSLSATKLLFHLKERLQVEMEATQVFSAPTLVELACLIESQQKECTPVVPYSHSKSQSQRRNVLHIHYRADVDPYKE